MPLPLSINLRIAEHYLSSMLSKENNIHRDAHGKQRIPLVLMLEITHACNLRCKGCGRIREYQSTLAERFTFQQVQKAIQQVNTPVVILSGGEPLLHPEVPEFSRYALDQDKVVYLCTNGLLLTKRLQEFSPNPTFSFNVHLDGPAEIHDELTGLPGTTERALEGIQQALHAGFHVTSNTTIYRQTSPEDITALFEQLTNLGIKGLMIAPAFAYEAGTEANTLSREEAHAWFRELYKLWGDRNMVHTPLYMQFLRGERQLDCMPWGTVTYNPQGWKSPCYLLTDTHLGSYKELMEETTWEDYGPVHEARCADCLLHSGFEPSVVNSIRGLNDGWKSLISILRWQMGK
jgi:hopanoid biosynthesis associated radical SAM protein HpnH